MTRITFTILLALFLTICAYSQTSIKIGTAAPDFSSTSLDGTRFNLDDLRGRVVVVTFWSTRCAICHHEIPKLNRMTTRFDPTKVAFVALSMESEEKIAGYIKTTPFNFQILPNSFGVVLQYADRDKSGSLDMGFPSFFVLDQQGIVRHRSSGYDKTDTVQNAVGKLLSK